MTMTRTFVGRAVAPFIASGIGLRTRFMRAQALYRQRRALARLDAVRLNDIGRTRDEAQAESRRPVWDAPSHWYR